VSDDLKLPKDVIARVALEAGKDAAKKALAGVLPEEDGALAQSASGEKSPEAQRAATLRRWKILAVVVLSLSVVIGVIGLVISYWQWFLFAGVLGLAGLYGYYRLRKRGAKSEAVSKPEPVAAKKLTTKAPVRVDAEDEAEALAEKRAQTEAARKQSAEERARQVEAKREARAVREQEVDDELAALKARLKK